MSDVVRIENCNIKDSKGVILKDISLSIADRECVGIMGESGSGKTMTVKALLGILPDDVEMTSSKLEIDGVDITKLKKRELRKIRGTNIGLVPQNTVDYLHPYIKIKEQMIDGYLTYHKEKKSEALKKAAKLLAHTGIKDTERVLESYPSELSGGMRQRVNIAMAMMSSPRLIIADEPTSALDAIIRHQVATLFFSLAREEHFSILLVSHDLQFMKKYCDRIIVMYAGRIVEEADAETLFTSPMHPYTKALLSLMPELNYDRRETLPELPGFVPEEDRGRESCIFASRCSHCMPECIKTVKKIEIGDHMVLCNLYKGEDVNANT